MAAERVQPLLARRVEAVHERRLPDHLGVERVAADHAAATLRTVSGEPPWPMPVMPGIGVDQDDHIALRKRLRPVAVVVLRVEQTDARHLRRREASSVRAAAAARAH
jgi:hypothetical protein